MKKKLLFAIEHLEPEIERWLYLEYMHASQIIGKENLVFTNIKKEGDAKKLSNLGVVKSESFAEIFRPEETLILDPKASRKLEPSDFKEKKVVVIGGILGDHPPKGRTRKLVTAKLPSATVRSLGDGQFSIDGAVYLAKAVSEGKLLENIQIKKGLVIKFNRYGKIYLPYAYPLRNGTPVINEVLLKYLASNQIVEDEEVLLKIGALTK